MTMADFFRKPAADPSLTRVELARLEGAITMLASTVAAGHSDHDTRLRDHETRIRQGERWRYALPLAALGTFASTILAIVTMVTR